MGCGAWKLGFRGFRAEVPEIEFLEEGLRFQGAGLVQVADLTAKDARVQGLTCMR